MKVCGAVMLPYSAFVCASNQKVDASLLGAGQRFFDGEERMMQNIAHSNVESLTLEYAIKNVNELVSSVPASNGDHRLTPMQRLATALTAKDFDKTMHIKVKAQGVKRLTEVCYTLHPHARTDIFINNLGVASGKTRATLYSTMHRVATPEAWKRTQEEHVKLTERGVNVPHLGLNKVTQIDHKVGGECMVARVVIALVPPPVMAQWEEASVNLSATFGSNGWITWRGLGTAKKRSSTTSTGSAFSMPEAIRLTKEKNKAIFWVMEACTKSSTAALFTAPEYSVPFRIIDEGTGAHLTEPRTNKPQSKCHYTYICNATLSQLEEHTNQQPKHPLRRALDGQNMCLHKPSHCAIAKMCSLPSWLRQAVAMSMEPFMPQGILKISMRAQIKSLAGTITGGSDLVITSTAHLVEGLVVQNCPSMSVEERDNLSTKCVAILNNTDPSESIANNLNKAIANVEADEAALPPLPIALVNDNNRPIFTESQRLEHADIERHKRAYATMKRLFSNLMRAISLDPPPECPITLDVIPPEQVCIASCCTGMYDKRSLEQLLVLGRCALCRQPLTGFASAVNVVDTLVAPPPPPPEPSQQNELFVRKGDTESLMQAFKAAAGTKCNSSLDAVTKSLKLALQFKPKGMRVLLCCNLRGPNKSYNAGCDEAKNAAKTCEYLKSAIPSFSSICTVGRHTDARLAKFRADDNTNRIFIIDTSSQTATMAGLHLPETDLVVFDRLSSDGSMETAKIVQSIGRAMRVQKGSVSEEKLCRRHFREHGTSRHAAKIVVFIDKSSA